MKKNVKVLIVDDELPNIEIMLEILRYYPQYECRWALSGEEALTVLRSYHPEIILLDVKMSGIDGYEVCRRVKIQNEHKFAKIIMISGMSLIDDRLKGYDAGADDYLAKPYVEGEFIAKLEVYSKLNRIEEVDTLKTTALNLLQHEIRTPLNGIILGSDLLMNMDHLSEKARGYVDLVRQSGLKIQDLVEKISRYYRLKDGITLNPSSTHVCDILSNIISSISENHSTKKVVLQCEDNLQYVGDWQLLTEAITYLIENLLKTSAEQSVRVYCHQQAKALIVQIGDKPLDQESLIREDVFNGFFSSDLLHHHEGSGLELAIASEIIGEHGGQINCRKKENGDTLYEIVLGAERIA